jgi:signal peptidase II
MKKSFIVLFVLLTVLIIDQALKVWVKTHMEYGEQFSILGQSWAFIHFVENNGMAFGLSLGETKGKLLLSLFRIFAVAFLFYYIIKMIKEKQSDLQLVCFTLILAGALGNIIDSAFYGLIFSETPYHSGVATLFPKDGGYAGFLYGKVVDMLYFPMLEGNFPRWVPFWGGEHFLFFRPVFNIADSSISIGVLLILIFQKRFFSHTTNSQELAEQEES